MRRITAIGPYEGPVDDDGMVNVYDLTVDDTHLYTVNNLLVSNSKRVSMMDVNALLSAGGLETLRDARLVKGQQNDRWWLQFMMGYRPEDPKTPIAYEKFLHQLKSSGIDLLQKDHRTHFLPMTDQAVEAMAGDREIKSGETVQFDKDLKPVPGGLFDNKLTGGHSGKQWSYLKLPEAYPAPVFEEPIRRLLDLTQKQFDQVIAGETPLKHFGTGPGAIREALDQINLPQEITRQRGEYEHGRGSKRDAALRKWQYLSTLDKQGFHPRDWMLSKVPVLPPLYRPISVMGGSNVPLVSDPNYLYKELVQAVQNHSKLKDLVGESDTGPERRAIYNAFKAVAGLADPVNPKLQAKKVQGVIASVLGSSPKFSTLQRKLLSTTVDAVGRGVIAPNPDLSLDQVGIPENQAFDIYSKFIVRQLRRRGMPIREALHHVRERTPLARETLSKEMDGAPVQINRAPVLHKFGILSFRPKLVKGDVIQMPPLVYSGYGADNDGDAVQIHVPTSEEAVKEAYTKLLPSKSLISPADLKTPVFRPTQEFLSGLHRATSPDRVSSRPPRVFRSKQDALAAYHRGEIGVNDRVTIMGE